MKNIILSALALLLCQGALAQRLSLDSLIEQNNPQLRLARQVAEAEIAEMKATNGVGETAVEYTPFFQKGADGTASSELIVSQEFDFPTLYAARHKAAQLQQKVLDRQYLVQRYETLREAHDLYYDYLYTREKGALLVKRLEAADSLLAVCEHRLRQGDATLMEQNRVRMDRMTLLAEQRANSAELSRLALALQRLGLPAEVDITTLTLMPLGEHPLMHMPEVAIAKARQDVALAKQGWLPKLSIGYRRNTELHEYALNGVLVGMSVPLFSNAKNVRVARQRQKVAEQETQNALREVQLQRLALEDEAMRLKAVLDAYDQSLMTQTLTTLLRAVSCGQLSISDYYAEAERTYAVMQQRLDTLFEYHKVVAKL